MFSFSNWIITIAGASLLISLLEIILPVGKMNFFIKNIINLFYMYIVIFPVIQFLQSIL